MSLRAFVFDKNTTPQKLNFSWHAKLKAPIADIISPRQLKSRSFITQASDSDPVNPGPIDSPLMQSMQLKIKEHLNAESVCVTDAYGDGRHISIDVVSSAFEGKSAVNRQRMVYKAIWEELQTTVHAVDHMTTRTPFEAANNK